MKKHKRKAFISFFSLFLLVGITSSTALISTSNNNNNTTVVANNYTSNQTPPIFGWEMFDTVGNNNLNQTSNDEIDWTKKTGPAGVCFDGDFAYENDKKTVLLGMDPNSSQTNVTIPATVTEIKGYTKISDTSRSFTKTKVGAFEGITKLEEVKIEGQSVTIDANAFKDCTSLKKVNITNNGIRTIGSSAFENCTSLADIKLSSSLTTIGDSSFKNTSSLKSIDFPSTLNKIGKSAFESSGLTSANLSSTRIRNIEEGMFKNCKSLTSVNFSNSTSSIGTSAFEGTGIKVLSINSNLTSLGTAAFKDCTSLTSFSVTGRNARLSKLYDSVFEGCTNLTTVNFGNNRNFSSIGNKAFKSTKIATFDLTAVQSIGESAFENCSSLKSLTTAAVLSFIGNNAFKSSSLNEITTSKSPSNDGNVNLQKIITIGDSAFYGTKIKKIETGTQLTKIGDSSFKSISTLESANFSKSSSLTKNENAFDAKDLSKVTWPSNKKVTRRPIIF